jgi:hypothetical protein
LSLRGQTRAYVKQAEMPIALQVLDLAIASDSWGWQIAGRLIR